MGSICCKSGQAQEKIFLKGEKNQSGIDKTENPQQGRGEEFDPSGDDYLQIA